MTTKYLTTLFALSSFVAVPSLAQAADAPARSLDPVAEEDDDDDDDDESEDVECDEDADEADGECDAVGKATCDATIAPDAGFGAMLIGLGLLGWRRRSPRP